MYEKMRKKKRVDFSMFAELLRVEEEFARAFERIEKERDGTDANSLRGRRVANILRGVAERRNECFIDAIDIQRGRI